MTDICQVPDCGKHATFQSHPANATHPDETGMQTCDEHLSEGMSHLPGQPEPTNWLVFPIHDVVACSECHPSIFTNKELMLMREAILAEANKLDSDEVSFGPRSVAERLRSIVNAPFAA